MLLNYIFSIKVSVDFRKCSLSYMGFIKIQVISHGHVSGLRSNCDDRFGNW